MSDSLDFEILDSIASIPAADWNGMAGENPFLRHEFLSALHETGCASEATGWVPQYVTAWKGGRFAGAMPLYLKFHSYGEYVFDWAWAEAYHRHGLRYYPKLLCAVPFTPVTGPRLLARAPQVRSHLIARALRLMETSGSSSLHCLFPTAGEAAELQGHGMMLRSHVQFHWHNAGYGEFNEFLATLSHDKRKKIKQERRRVREAGISFERLNGEQISEADWRFFARCYKHTYHQHQSTPYLTLAFFRKLGEALPQNLLLVIALLQGKPIASALDIHTTEALYGRYWGSLADVPGLHFETCYYQAIEFCIERKIRVFEGGAQGEHKLARGLVPIKTVSAHCLVHPQFASAVHEYLRRESRGIERYISELKDSSPYKTGLANSR
jgi:uncharacterized protein